MFTIKEHLCGVVDRIIVGRIGTRGLCLVRWTVQSKKPDERKTRFAVYQGDKAGNAISEFGVIFTAGELRQLAKVLTDAVDAGKVDDTVGIDEFESCKRVMAIAMKG